MMRVAVTGFAVLIGVLLVAQTIRAEGDITTDSVALHPLILVGDPDGTPPDDPSLHVDPNVAGSPYAGVGSVRVSLTGGYIMGSGALISPWHVLTAAHLFDTNADGVSDHPASDVVFYVNNAAMPTIIPAASLVIHPDFTGFDNPVVNDDLAIITLATPVAAGVPIYPLLQSPLAEGTQTIQVGYGRSGDGVSGFTVSSSLLVKRLGANVFDVFEEDDDQLPGNGINEVWMSDFDGPTAATNLIGGTTLGNDIETNLGSGDSGGPSFIDVDGQLTLVGTNTFGFSDDGGATWPLFGSGSGGILVEPYIDWINTVVPEPATMGLLAVGLAVIVLRRRKLRRIPSAI
jgi:Trypsin/PEP-CTERM motif